MIVSVISGARVDQISSLPESPISLQQHNQGKQPIFIGHEEITIRQQHTKMEGKNKMNFSKTTISTIGNYGGNSSNQPQHIPNSPLTTIHPGNLVRDNTIVSSPPQTATVRTGTVGGEHDNITSTMASPLTTLSSLHTGSAVARRRRGKLKRVRHFLRKRLLSCVQRPRTDD